jgi:hypothetical protein
MVHDHRKKSITLKDTKVFASDRIAAVRDVAEYLNVPVGEANRLVSREPMDLSINEGFQYAEAAE